jgi:cytochrome c peroxidase
LVLVSVGAWGVCVAAHAADSSAGAFDWHLPPGFPRPAVPADNAMSSAKVALGRRLFHETRLSSTGQYACASCHRPELAFTDGKSHALGATGEPVKRAAMTLTNVAYNAAFTWGNSSMRSLEAQMRQPLFGEHPLEMGLAGNERRVLDALSGDAEYRQEFAAAFPGVAASISVDNVIKAIASFERTLISGRSPFDRYMFDDDRTALSESAKRGMALFFAARVGCVQCHSGLNFSGPIIFEGHETGSAIFANTGLYDLDGKGSYPRNDRGLIDVSHKAGDMGKFRVPTLRNVALTAPYMHDGSLLTLGEVIDHYARGGREFGRPERAIATSRNPLKDPRVRPFTLSGAERDDLIAFLGSLTDREFLNRESAQSN